MARNGSGTFSSPYPNFVSGTVISSTQVDANNSDIATALTQSIAVDGQSTVTGNIPLSTYKLTGVGAGSAATDSLTLGQAQAEAMHWCGTAGGAANAITLAPSPAITAYAAGQRFVWKASSNVNTGATTVAISGLAAIALQDNGAAFVAGNHAANKFFMGILDTATTMQVMQVQISGTDPLIVSSITGLTSINSGQIGGRRNIIYNGEMKVAQRATSATGLGAAAGYFTLDRWQINVGSTAGRFTMAQVADGPPGFANSMKFSTTTADTSIAAGEVFFLRQLLEGQDLQQLKKGTASSEQVTVSFWVKGNASATYVCELEDHDNSRVIGQSFAVTTSWNRIELTFAADTSDPLNDDNALSFAVNFWLHAGSTYAGGTFSSNTWADTVQANRAAGISSIFDADSRTLFLTGVQMEIGATATEFESRTFGEELALCQRYFQYFPNLYVLGYNGGGTSIYAELMLPCQMRTAATSSIVVVSNSNTNTNLSTNVVYKDSLRLTTTITSTGAGYSGGHLSLAAEL
jgi:hypothetical protein